MGMQGHYLDLSSNIPQVGDCSFKQCDRCRDGNDNGCSVCMPGT